MLLRSLASRLGAGDRLTIASVIFGAVHLAPGLAWQANLSTFVLIGVFGASMGLVVRFTNRLGPALVAHTLTLVFSFSLLIARTSA